MEQEEEEEEGGARWLEDRIGMSKEQKGEREGLREGERRVLFL